MVLLLLVRVKVVYFVTVKGDPFLRRWSLFLIGYLLVGGYSVGCRKHMLEFAGESYRFRQRLQQDEQDKREA